MATATMTTDSTITPADRVRAGYFGLKLPETPKAVEPTPSRLSDPDRLWMAETTALLFTMDAVEAIEEGRTDDARTTLDGIEPENVEAFRSFVKMFGSTATDWASWLKLCLEGSPVAFEPPTPRRVGNFGPTLEEDAERLGYEHGNLGENASPPTEWSASRKEAFHKGLEAGRIDLEQDTLEYHAWLDELDRDREALRAGTEATWHESELRQARSSSGHPAFEE